MNFKSAALCILSATTLSATTLSLTACGGGGSSAPTTSAPTTPTTPTVITCANGSTATSATACPAVSGTQSIAPAGTAAAPSFSVSGLPAGAVLSGGSVIATPQPNAYGSIIGASVTLSVNANGQISLPANTTLRPGATYNFAGTLTFSNAPDKAVSGSFTVPGYSMAQLDAANPPKPVNTTVWIDVNAASAPAGAVIHNTSASRRLASLNTQIGDANWWSKMMDGSITQWTTPLTQVGATAPFNGALRVVMYTRFDLGGTNTCVRMILASNGVDSENSPTTNNFGCTGTEYLTWVRVENDAVYLKSVGNPAVNCTKLDWNTALLQYRVTYITDAAKCAP